MQKFLVHYSLVQQSLVQHSHAEGLLSCVSLFAEVPNDAALYGTVLSGAALFGTVLFG